MMDELGFDGAETTRSLQHRRPRRLRREPPEPEKSEGEKDLELMELRKANDRLKRFGELGATEDIDKLLRSAETQMPYIDSERQYLYEVDSQNKIWTIMLIISVVMFIFSSLLSFGA